MSDTRFHQQCVSPRARALASERAYAVRELEKAQAALRQRHSLTMVSTDYQPCGHLEKRITSCTRFIDKVDQEIRGELVSTCTGCPQRFDCPSRLT